MSNRLLYWFIMIITATLISAMLCTIALAHPGSTDGNGGHYDLSTGEYHYHHGYPAHSHYDTDGDGVIDCPYDFDDQTDRTNHGGTSPNTNNGLTGTNLPSPTTPKKINQTTTEEEPTVPSWVYWTFAALIFIIFILLLMNRNKKEELRNMKTVHLAEIRAIRQDCEEQLQLHHATVSESEILNSKVESLRKVNIELLDQIAIETKELERVKRLRCRMEGAPAEITFTSSGMPIYHKPNKRKPYGDYTVFVNEKTKIYHVDLLCASYCATTSHVFDVLDHMKACKKCASGYFPFTHAPDWYKRQD